MHQAVR